MCDTIPAGDEVAHYGLVSPAHYGFWKALTGRVAPANRLWETPDIPPGVFLSYRDTTKGGKMDAAVGDRVEAQPKRVHSARRSGTVEAVIGGSPSRYQVRWDDGRSTIISAMDGALRIVSRKKRSPSRRTAKP